VAVLSPRLFLSFTLRFLAFSFQLLSTLKKVKNAKRKMQNHSLKFKTYLAQAVLAEKYRATLSQRPAL